MEMVSSFLRGLTAGGTLAAVSAWACYRVLLEPRIHIDYQESTNRFDDVKKAYPHSTQVLLKYGPPVRSPEISVFRNHVLCYDQQKRIPHWVAEHITKHQVTGSANRKQSQFQPDPSVPAMFSAQNNDYFKSGWSRGHMAPAADSKFDQDAMSETFYLSNILPQDIDNNAGFWNRFEMYCRDLTKKFDHVWIISGPLFISYTSKSGKRRIKYEVIGNSEVAVPTHLFKVIVAENDSPNDKTLLGAFVIPNKPISKEHLLKEYQVPLEYIESKAGLTMLPKLDRKQARNLCKEEGCEVISWEKFEAFFIGRKLESANTMHRLEKVWKELSDKGIRPDETLISIYNSKRKELEGKEVTRKQG